MGASSPATGKGLTMDCIIPGEPQGKARPRFSRRSGTVYTPAKTRCYERRIAAAYQEEGGEKYPAGCYVRVLIRAFFQVPKSWSKAKREKALAGEIRPDKKPDIDNVEKVVLDSLNGIAYDDDKQVVYIACKKEYANTGELWICVVEDKV